jgi:hypothetical protein
MSQRQYFYAVLGILLAVLFMSVLDSLLREHTAGIALLTDDALCIGAVVGTEIWFEKEL